MYFNTTSFIGSSLRIGSAIVIFVGASLIVPKIPEAAASLKNIGGNVTNSQESSSEYEPRDFGLPASSYGSGTRL